MASAGGSLLHANQGEVVGGSLLHANQGEVVGAVRRTSLGFHASKLQSADDAQDEVALWRARASTVAVASREVEMTVVAHRYSA